jgi:hypothetical protein
VTLLLAAIGIKCLVAVEFSPAITLAHIPLPCASPPSSPHSASRSSPTPPTSARRSAQASVRVSLPAFGPASARASASTSVSASAPAWPTAFDRAVSAAPSRPRPSRASTLGHVPARTVPVCPVRAATSVWASQPTIRRSGWGARARMAEEWKDRAPKTIIANAYSVSLNAPVHSDE